MAGQTTVVAGLIEIQKIATTEDLAGMTGLYYSLSYVGFLLPAILAAASNNIGYPILLGTVAAVTIARTIAVAAGFRTREAN